MSHDEGPLASFNIQTPQLPGGFNTQYGTKQAPTCTTIRAQKSKLFWCGSTLLRYHLQLRVDYAILVEKEYKYARMDQYTHVASKISVLVPERLEPSQMPVPRGKEGAWGGRFRRSSGPQEKTGHTPSWLPLDEDLTLRKSE
jgi:hypothetical protein